MAVYIGIDPGVSGAIASWSSVSNQWKVSDMPTLRETVGRSSRRRIDAGGLCAVLRDHVGFHAGLVMLEKVNAFPGQGVASMFSFGRSLGIVEGVVASCGLSLTWTLPKEWQKAVGATRDNSVARAVELFPWLRQAVDVTAGHNRADAILMAYYLTTRTAGKVSPQVVANAKLADTRPQV